MRKALIIGLGGTGLRVVKDIRERIIWEYGSLDRVPFVEFLGIDTALDDRLVDVNDFYHAVVDGGGDQDGGGVFAQMKRRPQAFSNIDLASWYDPEIFSSRDAITDGCHGVRMFGRLAFLESTNFQQIEQLLRAKIKKLMEVSPAQAGRAMVGPDVKEPPAVYFDPVINVYTVGNAVAGTGSGMVVDVGYFLQTLLPQFQGTRFRSLCILTLASSDDPDPIKLANTYATAMEVNHFSTNLVTHRVKYHGYTQPMERDTRPYDFLYLICTQRSQQAQQVADATQVVNHHQLEEIAGQYIYTDVTIEETAKRDGRRDDTRDLFTQPDLLRYPQRYFTFGLSSIEFPVRQCVRGCSYLLLRDTVDKWRGRKEASVTDLQGLQGDLGLPTTKASGAGPLRRELTASEGDPRKEGRNVSTSLRRILEDNAKGFEADPGSLERADRVLAAALGEAPGGTPQAGQSARFVEIIEGNRSRLARKIPEDVMKRVTDWCFDLERGPAYARELVAKAAAAVAARVKEQNNADFDQTVSQAQKRKEQAEDDLQLAAHDPLLRFPFPLPRLWAIRVYKRAYQRRAEEYYERKVDQICAREEARLLGEVQETLAQLESRLQRFGDYLQAARDHFHTSYETCLEPVNINGFSLLEDPAGTISGYYEELLPAPGKRVQAMAEILRGLSALRAEAFPNAAEAEAGRFGSPDGSKYDEEEDQRYRQLADRYFVKIANQDVLSLLMKRPDCEAMIGQAFALSGWFLNLALGDPNYEDHTRKQKRYVLFHGARADNPPAAVADFRKVLTEKVRALDLKEELYELPSRHQVIFLQERGAFPMRLISSLGSTSASRMAEIQSRRTRADVLFTPLTINDRDELEKAEELVLVGIALAILKRETDEDGFPEFLLEDDQPVGLHKAASSRFSRSLGTAALALYQHAPALRKLEAEIAKFRKDKKKGDAELVDRLAAFPGQLRTFGLEGLTPDQAKEILWRYLLRDQDLTRTYRQKFLRDDDHARAEFIDPAKQPEGKKDPFVGYYCTNPACHYYFGENQGNLPMQCPVCKK